MKIKIFSLVLRGAISFSFLFSIFGTSIVSNAQSTQGWSDPVNLSNSGSSINPSMVIDSNGVIHVIWMDRIDGYQYVRSVDGGVTWTAPKAVPFPFFKESESPPVLIAGKEGEIHILWLDENSSLFYSRAASSNLDQPATWTGTSKISDTVTSFDAVVGSNNVLHLGYLNSLGSKGQPAGIYYKHFDRSSWSPEKNLYSSKYYRSLVSADTNISLAVTDEKDANRVIVAWDDRLLKRIFWAKSSDGGNSWGDTLQVGGPEDLAGSEMPYNIKASTSNNKILLLWQVGIPGSRCIQYSQWSLDDGAHFEKPVKVLDDAAGCPKQGDVIAQRKDFSVSLVNIQDEISLVAWDGSRWSKPQSQRELSTFPNPLTFDNVLLGSQNISLYNETLFVVGADTGSGGDIWFRSRPLGSLDAWFPPPSTWTAPVVVATTRQTVSSLISVADTKNNIYAFWVQTPVADAAGGESTIVYSKWDGNRWTKPANILSGFNGVPNQLSSTIDAQGRLLLSWVEGENGDLYFSWANSERANLASEWFQPKQLPSTSQLNSSPDILVDHAGRIVVVYTVPLNEDRGVYIVQSTDLGQTWTQPTLILDAVAAGWSLVDQPVVGLSGDGNLHVLFTRSSLRENDEARGLYYSKSMDGGITWSEPELVSEKNIRWSRIICLDGQTIHRLWREDNGNTSDIFHQVSRDGGITWENSVKVLSQSSASASELAGTVADHLYIAESHVEAENMIVDIHEWDGSHWLTLESKTFNLDASNAKALVTATIGYQGNLTVIASALYPELRADLQNQVFSSGRSLDISGEKEPPAALQISTPSVSTSPTLVSDIQVTPTESAPLADLGDAPVSPKNQIGIILVGVIVFLIAIFVIPRRKK